MPITLSNHCILRYQDRVAPHPPKTPLYLPLEACREELMEALSRPPLFIKVEQDGNELWGCMNCRGYPFILKVSKSESGEARAETCGPSWFWKETRHHWRALGYDGFRTDMIVGESRDDYRKRTNTHIASKSLSDSGVCLETL